jgi:hypothetical protein
VRVLEEEEASSSPSLIQGIEELVDVAVIAMLIFELLDVFCCGVAGAASMFLNDLVESRIYVLCHARGVAANIETGAVF